MTFSMLSKLLQIKTKYIVLYLVVDSEVFVEITIINKVIVLIFYFSHILKYRESIISVFSGKIRFGYPELKKFGNKVGCMPTCP